MVNKAMQSNVLRRRRPSTQKLRERLFCTPAEAAVFLGVSADAIKSRTKRGTMVGVARAIDGSLWSPGGRGKIVIEAAVLRRHLSDTTRELFDAWQAGRVSFASVKRQLRAEGNGR